MNVLIIHHVEPMWQSCFDEQESQYLRKIQRFVKKNDFDKIIATSLEGDHYDEIKRLATELEDWSYCWEDPEDECNHRWYEDCSIPLSDIIPVTTHHQFAYIYPWIKSLKKATSITLIGGSQYECLRDLEETLDYLGIDFKLKKELIYG